MGAVDARRIAIRYVACFVTAVVLTACASHAYTNADAKLDARSACQEVIDSGSGDPHASPTKRHQLLQSAQRQSEKAARKDSQWLIVNRAVDSIVQGEAVNGYRGAPYYVYEKDLTTPFLVACQQAGIRP